MRQRDHYLVLGIAPIAKPEEVRTAYRELSRKLHPDANPGGGAAAVERMKAITDAHHVLSNRHLRDEYDRQPHFRLRVPKGYRAAVGRSFKTPAPERRPGLMDRFLRLFMKQEGPRPDRTKALTHFTMGLTMAEKSHFLADAKEEFGKALKHDPGFLEAAFNYSLMAYKVGDYDDVRSGLQRVLGLASDDRYARFLLDVLRPDSL